MIEQILGLLAKIPVFEYFQGRRTAQQEHDRKLFSQLDDVLSEAQLKDYLDGVLYERLPRQAVLPVERYLEWSRYEGNRFLGKHVQGARERLDDELGQLRDLAAKAFFPGNIADLYVLMPEQNPSLRSPTDEERRMFDEMGAKLAARVEHCTAAYKSFRKSVKTRLQI